MIDTARNKCPYDSSHVLDTHDAPFHVGQIGKIFEERRKHIGTYLVTGCNDVRQILLSAAMSFSDLQIQKMIALHRPDGGRAQAQRRFRAASNVAKCTCASMYPGQKPFAFEIDYLGARRRRSRCFSIPAIRPFSIVTVDVRQMVSAIRRRSRSRAETR